MQRTVAATAFTIAALVAVTLLGLRACEKMETPELKFATWADAIASGQTGPGKWIPAYLPASATDIRATYAVDSTFTLIEFGFEPNSPGELLRQCTPVKGDNVEFPNRFATWWPTKLRAHSNETMFRYFQCGPNEFVAISGNQGYFWRA